MFRRSSPFTADTSLLFLPHSHHTCSHTHKKIPGKSFFSLARAEFRDTFCFNQFFFTLLDVLVILVKKGKKIGKKSGQERPKTGGEWTGGGQSRFFWWNDRSFH